MRAKYKMRTVVEMFNNENGVPKMKLECGHIKTDPILHYGNEKAFIIGRLYHDLSDEPIRARCYECGKKV